MLYSIIGADNREYGPVEIDVLIQWAREGRVVPRTTVLQVDTGRRFLACDVAELAPVFAGAGTIAPPLQAPGTLSVAPPRALTLDTRGTSEKSKIAAGLLGILLGSFGAHRFYLGYTTIGALMLILTVATCGVGAAITSVWGIIEGILCLTGGMADANGRPLKD